MSLIIENQNNSDKLYPPNSVQGKDLFIHNLKNCKLKICDWVLSCTIESCQDCTIQIGPISQYCILKACENTIFSIASSEILIFSSSNLTLFIFCENDPQIQKSSALKFAPYNLSYSGQEQTFGRSSLNPFKDKWSEVLDHNREETHAHYELLPPRLFTEEKIEFEAFGEPVNPVPRHIHYGGALRYEIIPYSKSHKITVERRELPPSTVSVHCENDSRKYIPFGSSNKKETVAATTSREETVKKLTLRYNYSFDKGFDKHSVLIPVLAKEMIENTLEEIKKVLDLFNIQKKELEFAGVVSLISWFLLMIQMQLLRFTSEWLEPAWIAICVLMALTQIFIFGLCALKMAVYRKKYQEIVKEVVQTKIKDFQEVEAEMIAGLDYVEVYIKVVSPD